VTPAVTLLNHASVVLDLGPEVALLCDPWLKGTCFRDEWGLRFDNPDALAEAARCTHLWVSHFHGDHFHVATLRELVVRRPDLHVLGNDSINLGGETAFQDIGFSTITHLSERHPHQLTRDVRLTRIPTTRIDSMLLVEAGDWRLLNFNDCSLPLAALRSLRRRIGRIDVLLNNYNHAGKLLEHPPRPVSAVKESQLRTFRAVLETLEPRWVIPFASLHYYRAPETIDQNASLLSLDEVAACDPRVVAVPVGCRATFQASGAPVVERVHARVLESGFGRLTRTGGQPAADLARLADGFWARLSRQFVGLPRLLPGLVIRVTDQDVDLLVNPRGGTQVVAPRADAAIAAHSTSLARWFTESFGTDAFLVGGHFALLGPRLPLVRLLIMLGMMIDGRVTPRDLFSGLASRAGWSFLWNRREEILGLTLGGRLPIGDRV
jgi:L-ascorbate metabolism protein UlaG (beta-lactamase superfamily)